MLSLGYLRGQKEELPTWNGKSPLLCSINAKTTWQVLKNAFTNLIWFVAYPFLLLSKVWFETNACQPIFFSFYSCKRLILITFRQPFLSLAPPRRSKVVMSIVMFFKIQWIDNVQQPLFLRLYIKSAKEFELNTDKNQFQVSALKKTSIKECDPQLNQRPKPRNKSSCHENKSPKKRPVVWAFLPKDVTLSDHKNISNVFDVFKQCFCSKSNILFGLFCILIFNLGTSLTMFWFRLNF